MDTCPKFIFIVEPIPTQMATHGYPRPEGRMTNKKTIQIAGSPRGFQVICTRNSANVVHHGRITKPGIGNFSALVISSMVGDIERFNRGSVIR